MSEFSVLIPLDGTQFAEEALSILPLLKSIGVTDVHLISAWEDVVSYRGADQRFKELNEEGRTLLTSYLEAKATSIAALGLNVDTFIAAGDAAGEVLRVAEETQADLISLATHGRTGIERWRLGSVADKVIRGASCPTLLVGPNVKANLQNFSLRRIMVPLDGSSFAELALPVATALARNSASVVELVNVANLPTAWTADLHANANVAQVVDWLEEGGREYLSKINLTGVELERTVLRYVATGDVGPSLLLHLAEIPADLVVMTSHGRHGVSRWALGSVTEEVLRGPAPVLILRAGENKLSQLIADAIPNRKP